MEIGVNCRNWREGDSHGFGSTFWRKKVERKVNRKRGSKSNW
jgi:hypothetical protein